MIEAFSGLMEGEGGEAEIVPIAVKFRAGLKLGGIGKPMLKVSSRFGLGNLRL